MITANYVDHHNRDIHLEFMYWERGVRLQRPGQHVALLQSHALAVATLSPTNTQLLIRHLSSCQHLLCVCCRVSRFLCALQEWWCTAALRHVHVHRSIDELSRLLQDDFARLRKDEQLMYTWFMPMRNPRANFTNPLPARVHALDHPGAGACVVLRSQVCAYAAQAWREA